MSGVFAAGLAGCIAGVVHVLSGPDHLVAVLPFAVESRRRALRVGLLWGIGHGLGVLVLAGLFALGRQSIDVEGVSSWAEASVGFLLVGLGVWALRRSRLIVIHTHGHAHEGAKEDQHSHPHVHIGDRSVHEAHHPVVGQHERHSHSIVGFGVVHGVAGVSHLVAAGPMIALSGSSAAAYLLSYLLGGILSMALFAAAAGRLVHRTTWIPRSLGFAGLASVVIGCYWIWGSAGA